MTKKAFLICMVFFIMSVAVYGGGFALSGVGSKAIGMGGAFRGLADNWSAAYWNPAGLAQLSQSELNMMAITITPMPEYKPDITYDGFDVGYKNGEFRYPKYKTHFAPNGSGFYKIANKEDITFGVAIFAPYALGSDWDIFDPIYNDVVVPFPEIDHGANLKVVDIHPSFAKSFMDNQLMVGAGFSFMRGEIDFQKTVLIPTSLPRPHDNAAINAFLHGEGWGYGANFGILYKLSDNLQLGISGKTPATLKLDGENNSTLYAIDNISLQQTAIRQASNAAELALIDFIFSTEEVGAPSWTREASADLKLPADIGLGIAYKATEKMTLTMDFSYTLWSGLDSILINLEGADPPAYDSTQNTSVIRTQWEDIFRFSAGGLYQVFDPFQLRFGFYMDPSPIPDETFSPLFMDIGTKYSGNIGAAISVSGWEIGCNFEYIHFSEREIINETSNSFDFDNYPGLFRAYLIANHLSITYRF
ncbi:MAG: outer membrane protein transport protein [candidate division Zixibacteria bacterium]|nr:outer membrane protein transport protein [candidate division Zixibacteria bacterium]